MMFSSLDSHTNSISNSFNDSFDKYLINSAGNPFVSEPCDPNKFNILILQVTLLYLNIVTITNLTY